MKFLTASAGVSALLLGMLLMQPGFSADKATTTDKQDKKKATAAEKKTRLPNYYAQLNLTTEQHDNVLAVREKFGDQIADLQQQLKKLQDARNAEVRKLLSTEQQQQLTKLEAEAKERRAARTAANVKPAAANGKPASADAGKKTEKKDKDK